MFHLSCNAQLHELYGIISSHGLTGLQGHTCIKETMQNLQLQPLAFIAFAVNEAAVLLVTSVLWICHLNSGRSELLRSVIYITRLSRATGYNFGSCHHHYNFSDFPVV